jgi:predicted glycosyltransferase
MVNGRVWVDVLTPKQVLFFKPLIDELRSEGIEVLATSRKYREVAPLAERIGLDLRYVGGRGGKDPAEQLEAATKRQAEIIPIIKGFAPQVAVSIASAVCARVAFGLGTKHIAVNDSPHSEVAGRLSLPLSYHLMCPWVIPFGAWSPFGICRRQVTRYRALDPAVWLKRKAYGGPVPRLDAQKKTIAVRVQESDAPYLAGRDRSWTAVVLQKVAEAFSECNLVALCRYGYQVKEVRRAFGSKYIIPEEIVDGRGLLSSTDLFIGMGGTMNAEAALMGVPAISAFQGSLWTDAYLQKVGLLARVSGPDALLRQARLFLDGAFKEKFGKKARLVLDSMEDPVVKISSFIRGTIGQG